MYKCKETKQHIRLNTCTFLTLSLSASDRSATGSTRFVPDDVIYLHFDPNALAFALLMLRANHCASGSIEDQIFLEPRSAIVSFCGGRIEIILRILAFLVSSQYQNSPTGSFSTYIDPQYKMIQLGSVPALIAAAVAVVTVKDADMYIDEKSSDNVYAVTGYCLLQCILYAMMYQLLC